MNNSYEMYEDDLPNDEEYGEENVITSQELAEKQFRCLKYWEEEERMMLHHYHKELERIELWKTVKINRINKKKWWHEHGLHSYLEQNGKKKIDLVHGTVKKVKGREVVMVDDKDKFDEWFINQDHADDRFYLIKRTPSLDLIKKHVKATGEIPEGCNFVRNPDKIKIEINDEQEAVKVETVSDHEVVRHESLQDPWHCDIPFT